MEINEVFLKTSFKLPTSKRNLSLGESVKLEIEARVVAIQDNDLQDGTKDVIVKIKPETINEL